MTRVILTTFAGRRPNMEILMRHVDVLHARGLIAEWHLWDFTRNNRNDARWIHDTFHVPNPRSSYVKVFFPNCANGWTDYYKHYTRSSYPDHVIIKCDDDIVFIDADGFEGFIQRRLANKDDLLAFASIVNNGVCAHLQKKHGLIEGLGDFPYDVLRGKLWDDGRLAQRLHEYFVQNNDTWIKNTRALAPQVFRQPIGDRISINFFAICSKDLDIFQRIGVDDEHQLSVQMPIDTKRHNYVDLGFTVSHLSFFRQRENGLNEGHCQRLYATIAPPPLNP